MGWYILQHVEPSEFVLSFNNTPTFNKKKIHLKSSEVHFQFFFSFDNASILAFLYAVKIKCG